MLFFPSASCAFFVSLSPGWLSYVTSIGRFDVIDQCFFSCKLRFFGGMVGWLAGFVTKDWWVLFETRGSLVDGSSLC